MGRRSITQQSQAPVVPASGEDTTSDDGREVWGKKVDFLLSVIGFAVDLANVWRFPYLCYRNGGGAFLVPYTIMLVLGGIPLFFMELCIGQFNRKGAITCWGNLVPLFKGVGYAVVLIASYVDFFYNVILAWSLRYLIASFSSQLPWADCNNTWNTDNCVEIGQDFNSSTFSTDEQPGVSITTESDHIANSSGSLDVALQRTTSPAEEYWLYNVLEIDQSSGITDLGKIKWDLALCLLVVYLICYFSLWKGISTSGKVVWFTAVFPYVVLFILLIRGVTLPGSMQGIQYYLYPEFDKLKNSQVWVDAATQIFFSLGPGFGVLLAFASYNKFHNNVYKDAILTSLINCATSFLSGFVIFSVLGYMSYISGKPIDKVAQEGPGLVFVVYPQAIATMPFSTVWAILFFLMLLTLGLDSSFGGSTAVITGLGDEFPIIRSNREIFVAILFTVDFLIGLTCCTQGGFLVFQLLERYVFGFSILCAVFFEAIAVSYIYGVDRLVGDINDMIGFRPGIYWKLCWKFIGPVFIGTMMIFVLLAHENLSYEGYVFPEWCNTLGWMLALSSVAMIPAMAIYKLATTPGTLSERIRKCTTPARDLLPRSTYSLNGMNAVETQCSLNLNPAVPPGSTAV